MPGMGTYLQTRNSVVVSAFHTALLHQVLLVGLILVVLSLVSNVLRTTTIPAFGRPRMAR